MAEEVKEEFPKKKAKAEAKSSVKSLKHGIEVEKQKMGAYSKKMGASVRSLQAGFKKHAKDVKEAAIALREEGIKNMSEKVGKFKGDIKAQIKENKESVSHMGDNIKYYLSEINKTKNNFKSYAKAFLG